MVKNNRWGKEFKDKRDWVIYNEALIKRGEWFFDLSFLESLIEELECMNKKKVGRPYKYSNSFIEFETKLQPYFDLRSIEGICRGLAKKIDGFPVNDHTTISRRINRHELLFPTINYDKPIFVANDGSGIKVSNRGEWIRQKWKIRRGWIKAIITVNTEDKKLLDIEVFDKDQSEPDVFEKHVRELTVKGIKICKASGDGGHDQRKLFNTLKELNIEPTIKIRKNASTKAKGSIARAIEVKKYKEKGYETWAKEKKYGMRWATEAKFSCVKRKFGETIRCTNKKNMLQETKRKFLLYENMMTYATTNY